jgi:hypothetical protein
LAITKLNTQALAYVEFEANIMRIKDMLKMMMENEFLCNFFEMLSCKQLVPFSKKIRKEGYKLALLNKEDFALALGGPKMEVNIHYWHLQPQIKKGGNLTRI